MVTTKVIGDKGEQRAVDFLIAKGYEIVQRNYRYKRAEVDIVASKDKWLIFVEVKLRKNNLYGQPETFVSEKKVNLVHQAATIYIEDNCWKGHLRFDIISICGDEILHLEDAF